MSELLRGNFEVKKPVKIIDSSDDRENVNKEFQKKAMDSVGGSMVFIEREKLFWDDGIEGKS